MKALQLTAAGSPLRAVDLPVPQPGAGDLVVKVAAAGICRSDTHYRSGDPKLPPLPRVLGHEVAGWVEACGPDTSLRAGDPVALHYQVGCGRCGACRSGADRFCPTGEMIGNHRDGGFAEMILIPERNALPIPDGITMSHAAVMMCSSVTALHAIRRARLEPGERIAVFGVGGLGMSALQIAQALGAADVFAVDIDPGRLELAASMGAFAVNAASLDPVAALQSHGGVDVAVEFVGSATTTQQAVRSLRAGGRAAVAGLTSEATGISTYEDLMAREAELIGVMDHTIAEAREVLEFAQRGELSLEAVVTDTVDLDATAVNARLDTLEAFGAGVRSVITP